MPEFNVNLIAVLVGIVMMQVLGYLWYGPLFGNLWLRSIGKTREEISGGGGAIAISVVASAIAVVALAWLIGTAPAPDLTTGVVYGLLVSVGFVATTSITQGAYEDRSSTLTVLYIAYNVIGLTLAGALLGAWR